MLALMGRALGRLADWCAGLVPDDLFDCWLEEGEDE